MLEFDLGSEEIAEPEFAPPLEPDPAPDPRSLDVPKLDSPDVLSLGRPNVFSDLFSKLDTEPESIPDPGPLSDVAPDRIPVSDLNAVVLSSAGTTGTTPKPSTTITVIDTM